MAFFHLCYRFNFKILKNISGVVLLCLLVLFSSVTDVAVAQCVYKLHGRVVDADTREPLSFSNVVIIETQSGAATDENGNYVLTDICEGSYTVRVSHLTCESKEFKVRITSNTKRDFELPHRHNELLEICIVEEKQREVSTVAFMEVSGRELDKMRGQPLADALSNVAGVTALKTGSSISKPVIHGLQGNRVLILNNGIRQEGQQWGNEHAPEIDPFIAKLLTVIKGAGSVRYGSDAVAGVVLVEPDALPSVPGIGGELNLVGFSNNREGVVSAIMEQNLSKLPSLSWRLQGTIKKGGNTRTPDYWLKNTGYREQNFSATAGWSKPKYGAEIFYSQFNSEIGIFTGSHIGNLTDLENAFNSNEPAEPSGFTYKIDRPSQNAEHELTKAKIWLLTGNSGKLSVTYARQYNLRFEFDRGKPLNDSLAALNEPDLTYEITTHTADVVWEHNNIGGLQGITGISGMYQANTFEGRMFIPNYENYTAGIFLIERWKRNKLQIETGLRYDIKLLNVYMRRNTEVEEIPYSYNQLSATAGFLYDLLPHARLSFNAGTGWRAPGVNEMYSNGLHHGAAAVEIGDINLKEEKSINLIAGINIHDHHRYKAEAAVYFNTFTNFIYLQPVLPPTLTIRGAFPTFRYRQADAFLYGADFMFEYNLGKSWSADASLMLVRADNRSEGGFIPGMPSDRFSYGLKRKFKSFKNAKEMYVSADVRHVMRQTRLPDESDYIAPPAGYALVELEVGGEITIGKQPVWITLSVANLFNEKYRDYLNRYRYFADDEGRNVILKIKIPFSFKK